MPAASGPESPPTPDPADDAMVARARDRFAAERRRLRRRRRRAARRGALPNLIVIGALKGGTTSLHHYLSLHPEISMSRPKELNFFVAELNWELGTDWYASHFDRRAPVRGESSPHYTNLPRFRGVAERMAAVVPEAKLIYMVRDPIDRMLSHYLHNVGSDYESRPLAEALADPNGAYLARSRYAMQLAPYLEVYERGRILVVANEDLDRERRRTMREVFSFLGVDPEFDSPHFDRQWETGAARAKRGSGGFRLMDRAVRLPGLRAFDRNFDRLPEPLRWGVERLVHSPDEGRAPKPTLEPELRERLVELLADDVRELERICERSFGWFDESE